MLKTKWIVSLWLIFSLQACIRTEEIGTPWLTEPQPVVFSVLSTDRVPGVYLSKTYHPATSDSLLPYPDAQVFMAGDDLQWVELKRENPESRYFVDNEQKIVLKNGGNYKLKILTGTDEITATTRIPEDVAKILSAQCVLAPKTPNHSVGWNGYNVLKATITADLKLPVDKSTGVVITTNYYGFPQKHFQESEDFIWQDFYIPVDTTEFLLTIRTVDVQLKKYDIANSLSIEFDDEFLPEILMGTFSGVLPKYDNIVGGTGFFGSYSDETTKVQVQE